MIMLSWDNLEWAPNNLTQEVRKTNTDSLYFGDSGHWALHRLPLMTRLSSATSFFISPVIKCAGSVFITLIDDLVTAVLTFMCWWSSCEESTRDSLICEIPPCHSTKFARLNQRGKIIFKTFFCWCRLTRECCLAAPSKASARGGLWHHKLPWHPNAKCATSCFTCFSATQDDTD